MRSTIGLQILLLAKTLSVLGAVDFTVFSNSQVVTTGFTVYWSLGTDNITFGVNASTSGNWAAIGIAEPTSGSMPGADMAVLDIVNGAIRLQDYWASAKAYPNLDDCQSWYLNSSALSNGNVQAIFTRKINNSDTQDRAINTTAGYSTRMVWAYGSTTSLSYHSANRGPFALFLAGGADPVANSSWSTVDLNMTSYTVPSVYTTYACNSFFLPNSTTYYIKRFEFLNAHQVVKSQVHHIVLYSCSSASSSGFTQYYGNQQVCNFSTSGCQDVIYVWAPGQDVFQLPDGVSFQMGATGAAYAVIQVHYTNPNNVSGEIDSSGVRVFYDTIPTAHIAGVLQTGDAIVRAPPLPANTDLIHYEFSCPTQCTSGLSTNLTFFGSFLHMHGTGTMMYSTITSTATGVTSTMNRIEYYDYGFQQITPVNMVLSPGDHINTHCIYSTTGYSSPVTFGLATTNEMCIQFIFYYPKVNASACTYYPFVQPNTTYCGYGQTISGVQDPYTRDNSSLLTKQFGLTQSQCPAGASAVTIAPTTAPTSKKAAVGSNASLAALIVILGFFNFIF
eukprot:TRINITY_DN1764_c0_g1_i5.p1 TRINITY_DN1764_c0_g1~~TRINITY_DN1764_c0_g1_i5.p1  ORF type:complete len:573 (-),score=100.51 TRINITY_DN1764_c0_g1_i5:97-1776(-)